MVEDTSLTRSARAYWKSRRERVRAIATRAISRIYSTRACPDLAIGGSTSRRSGKTARQRGWSARP
jgi:hypothetical protein